VLPDWVDLQAVRMIVAAATVVAAVGAILVMALTRQAFLRFGVAVVLLGTAAALLVYFQGPLRDCEDTCDCRVLKSDVAVDGCAPLPPVADDAPKL
jgi:hypothetical protein